MDAPITPAQPTSEQPAPTGAVEKTLTPMAAEAAPNTVQGAPAGGPAVTPAANPALPPVPQTQTPAPAAPAAGGPGPALADDVDVIEKEWVDKAEEVVKKTAGDPHKEEEAVEELQVDYLKKRYGKDITKPQDG